MKEKKCTCGDTETQHYENTAKCVVCGCKEFEDGDMKRYITTDKSQRFKPGVIWTEKEIQEEAEHDFKILTISKDPTIFKPL
jgi:hypothetical protein